MSVDQSRRFFLRGKIRSEQPNIIFPPWALENFTELCVRCDECISNCEEKILTRGDGGFPQVNFSLGECTFCEKCVKSCQHKALDIKINPPWKTKAAISDKCFSANAVFCRSCGDICEQRAITFKLLIGGRALPSIADSLCNGCGACVSVCPANAIQLNNLVKSI